MRTLLVAVMVTGFIGVLAAPDVAEACTCAFGATASSPGDGATNVPTNTEIKVLVQGRVAPTDFVLEQAGQPLSLTQSIVGDESQRVVRLRPTEPLLPSTTYDLRTPEGQPVATFTTGTGPDATPPNAAVLLGQTYVSEDVSTCGPMVGYRVDVAAGVDDNAPNDDVWFLVYAGPSVADIDFTRPTAMFLPGGGFVGDSPCHDTIIFDQGPNLAIALRAVDRAGNESANSGSETLSSCGCAAGAGGPGALVWLAGMFVWCARRRHHQT